ncbi:hypothetical protein F4779DRAFT_607802 [Xylariaceae sp. FL0662B]|nr:hypothetical protein F4779DRAFT_607802 [Xylariaceae sp. FL0662B]
MAELATLNHDLSRDIYPERPQETIFQLYPAGPYIRTTGVELFRDSVGDCPTPALDGHLRNLIGACLAVRRQDRPLLATLADQVITAIQERDADFYADLELNWGSQIDSSLESDAHIKTLVQELTVNASTTEALPNFMKTKYDMS